MRAMPPTPLTGAQRRKLRSLAHGLKPIVQLGSSGRTERLDHEIDAALANHELIKIRFVDHKDDRRRIADEIAAALGAHVAGIVGHVAIFYRPAADEKDQRVDLG